MLPGPTCFQPVRSLPLKSCRGCSGSPEQAFCESGAAADTTAKQARKQRLTIKRFLKCTSRAKHARKASRRNMNVKALMRNIESIQYGQMTVRADGSFSPLR